MLASSVPLPHIARRPGDEASQMQRVFHTSRLTRREKAGKYGGRIKRDGGRRDVIVRPAGVNLKMINVYITS